MDSPCTELTRPASPTPDPESTICRPKDLHMGMEMWGWRKCTLTPPTHTPPASKGIHRAASAAWGHVYISNVPQSPLSVGSRVAGGEGKLWLPGSQEGTRASSQAWAFTWIALCLWWILGDSECPKANPKAVELLSPQVHGTCSIQGL